MELIVALFLFILVWAMLVSAFGEFLGFMAMTLFVTITIMGAIQKSK